MALIIATRSTLPKEPGDILIDGDIFRPSGTANSVRATWYLKEDGASYLVVGGCSVGLELYSHGDRVDLKPIDRGDYSHMLVAHD